MFMYVYVSFIWVPTGRDFTPEKVQRPRKDSWTQMASLMEREPRIGSAPREDHLDGLRHPDGGVKERVRKCEEYCMSNIVE